jgi:YesN/AraC family two-component response regulator
MIIGTITALALLFGGGGAFQIDAMEPAVKEYVSDPVRVEQILEIVKGANEEIKHYYKDNGKYIDQFEKLTKQHDAKREEFLTIFAKADERRRLGQERLIAKRDAMKKLMTEEEWNNVIKKAQSDRGKG